MENTVVEYYTNSFSEHERHLDAFSQIQKIRTLKLFNQHLGSNQKVLDIGGATGVYSFELAKQGHQVDLLDIVPVHIEKAKKIAVSNGVELNGYHVGDAQELSFPDAMYDVVILHGPLYHITDKACRARVLNEAFRVLKPNGKVFAFAINRYAGLFYGIQSNQVLNDSYYNMLKREVKTGFRDRAPTWYFHLPDELEAEISNAKFVNIITKGVVSPVWMLPDIEEGLGNELVRHRVLEVSELVEDEPIIGQDFVSIGVKR